MALAAAPAWPFYNDRFELFLTETATWDSNVFRFSDATAQRTLGSTSTSDRILTHGVGLGTLLPWGLQRFEASYQHFWTRYDRFDHLNFDGDIWRALFAWTANRELSGEVGYNQSEGLASFAAFRGTERDVVTWRQAYANASWLMTPRYLAYFGLTGTERKHETPARRIHDLEARSAEARLSYVTPKDSRVGVSFRYEDGGSPTTTLFRGIPFDNAYKQWGVGIVGRWEIAGHSVLDGRADYVKREYDQFPERNYSGPSWGITHTWTPTAKLTFATTVRRDIAPIDEVQTSFVLATGASFKPRWQVTEKFALVGSADYVRWKYRGDPLIGNDFEHRVRSGQVGFAWTPYQRVVITGGFTREVRTSDLADADYKVNIGTLDARIGF